MSVSERIKAFCALSNLGLIPGSLDAFWVVVPPAAGRDDVYDPMPASTPFRACLSRLLEFGFHRDYAESVVREANGDWEVVMDLVGIR